MVVAVMRLDLLLHGPRSLKEKRGQLKKLLARLRSRFPASVAEVGLQDSWQRASIAVVMVASDASPLEGLADRVEDEIARSGLAETGVRQFELLHY